MKAITIAEFMQHVTPDASGCWLWHGDETQYGRFNGKAAHRLSWELHQGPIPDGLVLLHGCSVFRADRRDVRGCVNPAHLRPGTAADNGRDTVRVRRMATLAEPAVADGSPDALPAKHLHLKWNPWELEQLARIARRDCVPMTTLVRRMVRARLFEAAKL